MYIVSKTFGLISVSIAAKVGLKSSSSSSFEFSSLSNVSVIRDFLLNKLWHHPKVDKSKSLGKKVISDLFDFFIKDPNILINEEKLYNNKKTMAGKSSKSLERFVADKIASLTDRNALEMHKKYFKSNYIL